MNDFGRLLSGDPADLRHGVEALERIPVDRDQTGDAFAAAPRNETTLRDPIQLQGKGTFLGKELRTIRLEPAPAGTGWWMDRGDLPDCLPTLVSVRNVWTTGQVVSNIVLRSGPPQNYIRMVEHIIALKPGLHLDNVRVCLDSGDPPLFDRGSLDLVEKVEAVGILEQETPARWLTVSEPCCVCGPRGAFLALAPPTDGLPRLTIDAAVDFPNAIGRQRVRFHLDRPSFRTASVARTNTTAAKKFYCQTLGRVFADVR
ncbi:MAG: UDP-3-O-acyl-N-acetylglucosamine deacetylase, partial [Kiritimatiellia bacterium]|nr:UDP-3-O-acyl-N-acetylglucosamine deacetylase [Kiritimatiellia bacterium]